MFHIIKGTFHVKGFQPDGDSIRFRAANSELWKALDFKKPSKRKNPMMQLRLEGIDALEIHYNGYHQPRTFAIGALEKMLRLLGITGLRYSMSVRTITEANDGVEGFIAVSEIDAFNRPVCLIFNGKTDLTDGALMESRDLPIEQSINYLLCLKGLVYPTFYTTTDILLAEKFGQVSREAREANRGIWVIDRSDDFSLWDVRSMYDDLLILPKLFRRLTTYCEQYEDMSRLSEWLRVEKDLVRLQSGEMSSLDQLIQVTGKQIELLVAPETMFFVPKA